MQYVSMTEAAALAGVNPRTISRLIRRGELRSYRMANDLRVRLVAVDELHAVREVRPEAEAA